MGLQPHGEGPRGVMLRLHGHLDRPGVRLDPEVVGQLAKPALATLLLGGSPSAEGGSRQAPPAAPRRR